MAAFDFDPGEVFPAPVAGVAPRSVAARAGLRPGDLLLAVNGVPARDVIDVQVLTSEPRLIFLIERDGKRLERRARRRYGQPLGLTFETEVFDGPVRVCRNHCDFCFVAQMPPDLRGPLYVKDDDYRLSFLHGNYITLTNLSERDWERIEAYHLSPLYVSVHATEPDVRVSLMHNPRAGQIMAQLERLASLGIEVHTQAVLLPGRNDGAHLDRTIADLAGLHPHLRSLCVAPVGLTRWRHDALRPYTGAEAAPVLDQVAWWQAQLRERLGLAFVYASDEWYLLAGQDAPPLDAYDALLPALIENGVGMVRTFLERWPETQAKLARLGGTRQTWVTGTLFAPALATCAADFARETGVAVEVVATPNRAFGETVTVAGLLTAGDVIAALEAAPASRDVLVLPEAMFRGPEGCALDGGTRDDIQRHFNRPVHTVA
ncbi:MAG: DUF512 domain-containing protein [Anaerolineae bacterium]|nr:DUF512 domain-containing protein [Anaerolineae bacterium]